MNIWKLKWNTFLRAGKAPKSASYMIALDFKLCGKPFIKNVRENILHRRFYFHKSKLRSTTVSHKTFSRVNKFRYFLRTTVGAVTIYCSLLLVFSARAGVNANLFPLYQHNLRLRWLDARFLIFDNSVKLKFSGYSLSTRYRQWLSDGLFVL